MTPYARHLPAVLRDNPVVDLLLRIVGEEAFGPIETAIGELPRHLDPRAADPAFLPWLAGWLAVPVGPDPDVRDVAALRDLLTRIVPLYHRRGTASGLREMLEIALRGVSGAVVRVRDDLEEAHFFAVQVVLPAPDPDVIERARGIARAVIEREKPAHTWYALRIAVPAMRLVSERLHHDTGAPYLVLGENTVLGTGNR